MTEQPPYGQQPGWGQQPPYGQQPGWGQQPPYGQLPPGGPYGHGYQQPPTSGKATTVLVLGIVSLVTLFTCLVGFIPAIVALVLAGQADREIAESQGALTGESQVKAGRIMSWITLGITGVGLLALIGLIALVGATSSTS